MKELRAGFASAEADLAKDQCEAGPIGVMLRALRWADWKAIYATTFQSPSVGRLCVLETSPKQVARTFLQDVTRCTEARADAAVLRRERLDGFSGVWWEAARALVSGSGLSALERHVVISLLGGTYLTGQRARDWGYLVNGLCAHCGVADTVEH